MKISRSLKERVTINIFFILVLIVVGLRIFIASSYFKIQPNSKKKVIVVFRNDDIQEFRGTKLDFELFRLFQDNNIPQTYALVPFKVNFAKNRDLMKILKEHLSLGLAEIALHGYAHQDLGRDRLHTEFLGRPIDEQRQKISQGKAHLEQVLHTEILTFIPPFNSYDVDTIKACRENGIEIFSASPLYYADTGDIVIVNFNRILTDPIIEEIELASKNGPELSIFIIYYHSFMGNIYAEDDYYTRIKNLITYIKNKDNIEVMTLAEAGISYPTYFKQRYRTDLWKSRAGFLLKFFRQDGIYKKLGALHYCGYRKKLTLFIFSSISYIYGLLFLIGFLASQFLNFIRIDKRLLRLSLVAPLLIWICAVNSLGTDARIGIVDVSFLILYAGVIGGIYIMSLRANPANKD